MDRLVVLSDTDQLAVDLKHSLYHRYLAADERRAKFPGATDLVGACYRGCRVLTPRELAAIRPRIGRAVTELQGLVLGKGKKLELPFLNVVWLTNRSIEHGSSWTVGSTIVLSDWGAVEHEVCHVYQRLFPDPFDTLYCRDRSGGGLVWVRWDAQDVHRLVRATRAMDNPDCSVHDTRQYAYCNHERQCYTLPFYDKEDFTLMLVDVQLRAPHEVLQVRRRTSQWVDFHGRRLPLEHPHEMLAAWVSTKLLGPGPPNKCPS